MRRFLLLAALLIVCCAGCSIPRGRIQGKVTYQDKPLTEGTVIFIASDNMTYPTPIMPDGTYAIDGVPRGKLEVSVQVEEPRPMPRPDPTSPKNRQPGNDAAADDKAKMARLPAVPAAKGPRIPASYADPKKSGLRYELTGAVGEYNVELK